MVKSLCDICLLVIQGSFDKLPNIGDNIPTVYKELLIKRLAFHDLFKAEYVQFIARNLFCKSLNHVDFYKCDQIDDTVLKLLSQSGCKLVTLNIHGCNSVTGEISGSFHQNTLESYSQLTLYLTCQCWSLPIQQQIKICHRY